MVPQNERERLVVGKRPSLPSEILNQKAYECRKQVRPESQLPQVIIKFQRAVSKLIAINRANKKKQQEKKTRVSFGHILFGQNKVP